LTSGERGNEASKTEKRGDPRQGPKGKERGEGRKRVRRRGECKNLKKTRKKFFGIFSQKKGKGGKKKKFEGGSSKKSPTKHSHMKKEVVEQHLPFDAAVQER